MATYYKKFGLISINHRNNYWIDPSDYEFYDIWLQIECPFVETVNFYIFAPLQVRIIIIAFVTPNNHQNILLVYRE